MPRSSITPIAFGYDWPFLERYIGWIDHPGNPWFLSSRPILEEGPTPKFSLFHVWKTYDIINEKGPIGRKALSQTLGIGEGSTRTILDKMIREGSVENTKLGRCSPTGESSSSAMSGITAAPVKIDGLTISTQDCAVLVKGMADRIGTGYEQRDEAVRAGAVGATTLIVRNGKLLFPGDKIEPDQVTLGPHHVGVLRRGERRGHRRYGQLL